MQSSCNARISNFSAKSYALLVTNSSGPPTLKSKRRQRYVHK